MKDSSTTGLKGIISSILQRTFEVNDVSRLYISMTLLMARELEIIPRAKTQIFTREKYAKENAETPTYILYARVASPRDRNQSILEATNMNILTFMTKRAAGGRATRAQPTRTLRHRGEDSSPVGSYVKRCNSNDDVAPYWPIIESWETRHTFANVYSESLESKPEPQNPSLAATTLVQLRTRMSLRKGDDTIPLFTSRFFSFVRPTNVKTIVHPELISRIFLRLYPEI